MSFSSINLAFPAGIRIIDISQLFRPVQLSLEERISLHLQDSVKAHIINEAFEYCLLPHLKNLAPEIFSKFIQFIEVNARYMGAPEWDHWHFIGKNTELNDALSPISLHVVSFFESINRSLTPRRKIKAELEAKRINIVVITTAFCGGGHKSPSLAIQQVAQRCGIKVTLIDSTLACEYIEGAPYNIQSRNRMSQLRGVVNELCPDIIFSCVSHNWVDCQLAFDLGKKFVFIETDYELNPDLVGNCACDSCDLIFNKVSPKHVQVLTPSDKTDVMSQKVISRLGADAFRQLVRPFGFPVRESFVRETNQSTLLELRKQIGIRPEDQVVILMPCDTNDELIAVASALNSFPGCYESPLYVVIICGNNSETYRDLNGYITSMKCVHPQIKFKVEGLVDESTLATYMKVASQFNNSPGVLISKAGGSTLSESLEMGVYMLSMKSNEKSHPLERSNRAFLQEVGMGEELIDLSPRSVIKQVVPILGKRINEEKIYKPLDWKRNLIEVIQSNKSDSACEVFARSTQGVAVPDSAAGAASLSQDDIDDMYVP